jgi:hypothetical protein
VTSSQHPVDRLIRDLVDSGRAASEEEIAAIIARMASAPFDPQIVPVLRELRGTVYLGHSIGSRETSLIAHLVKRVVKEGQWAEGTTATTYTADLRRAVQHAEARLSLYYRRGGCIAVTLTPTDLVLSPAQRGPDSRPILLVVYSADRGIILSGYQVSALAQTGIPQEALWLNRR